MEAAAAVARFLRPLYRDSEASQATTTTALKACELQHQVAQESQSWYVPSCSSVEAEAAASEAADCHREAAEDDPTTGHDR